MDKCERKIIMDILVDAEGLKEFNDKLKMLNEIAKNEAKLASEANDDDTNSWHDNFAFEESVRKSRLISDNINKMLEDKEKLKLVEKHNLGSDYININDTIKVEFIYLNGEKEEDIIKLTGKYTPNLDSDITEITLNSEVGKAIYKAKIGSIVSFVLNAKKTSIHIIEKI